MCLLNKKIGIVFTRIGGCSKGVSLTLCQYHFHGYGILLYRNTNPANFILGGLLVPGVQENIRWTIFSKRGFTPFLTMNVFGCWTQNCNAWIILNPILPQQSRPFVLAIKPVCNESKIKRCMCIIKILSKKFKPNANDVFFSDLFIIIFFFGRLIQNDQKGHKST